MTRTGSPTLRVALAGALGLLLSACPSSETGEDAPLADAGPQPATKSWEVTLEKLPGALLSVWGTSSSNVWTVGGDARDGSGPLVLHYDGSKWARVSTGQTSGDLWWVFGFENGPVFMGGGGGVILRLENGSFTKMTTPGTNTVFGIWGDSATSLWAVGGNFDTDGFVWRFDGSAWRPEPSAPANELADAAMWKVCGRGASDVWLVGSKGLAYHFGGAALEKQATGVGTSLFTANASATRVAAVGGQASGFVLENDGSGWKKVHDATYGLTGVVLGPGETGYAVGSYASVYARDAKGWHEEDTGLAFQLDLHGVWIDPSGGAWAVGGRTASFPLINGVLIHKGDHVSSEGI